MIAAADFGVVADWCGDDDTATLNTAAVQAACEEAGRLFNPPAFVDGGGAAGEIVLLPRGGVLCGWISLPSYVRICGAAQYGTVLKMPDDFPADQNWITDNDLASFGGGLERLNLYSRNYNAISGASIFRCRSMQDTPIVRECRIYAGNRIGIDAGPGIGGATSITFDHVMINGTSNIGGIMNPLMVVDYGNPTTVNLRTLQFAGLAPYIPGSRGLVIKGGSIHAHDLHPENLQFGIEIANANGNTFINASQGHPEVFAPILISDPTPVGSVELRDIRRNASTGYTVNDGRPGRASRSESIGITPVIF